MRNLHLQYNYILGISRSIKPWGFLNKHLFKETTIKKVRKKLELRVSENEDNNEINLSEEGLVNFLRHFVVNVDVLEKKNKLLPTIIKIKHKKGKKDKDSVGKSGEGEDNVGEISKRGEGENSVVETNEEGGINSIIKIEVVEVDDNVTTQ